MKKVMKNKKFIMIFAMVLMVSLVVGMGAMTYAKYISNYDGGTHTATAAKWGFVVTADASDLFANEYDEANNDTYATVDETGNVVVKAAADASKIVAPGTMGYLLIDVGGMAEVKAQLNVTLELENTISDGATYNPIEWTLVADDDDLSAATWVSDPSDLSTSAVIEAGATVATKYKLYWRWAFSTNEDNDKKDTVIGASVAGTPLADVNAMTGLDLTEEQYEAYTNTIEFTATITIVQIQ